MKNLSKQGKFFDHDHDHDHETEGGRKEGDTKSLQTGEHRSPSFSYLLPADRIAQWPVDRGRSRLLIACGDTIRDAHFSDLIRYVHPGDLLVLNATAVSPARFFTRVRTTPIELLLLGEEEDGKWLALARPMRRLRSGDTLPLSPRLTASVSGRTADGERLRLSLSCSAGSILQALNEDGCMPIPPYIRSGKAEARDRELYQTVLASPNGTWESVAAPTAGLHFTAEMFDRLRAHGVKIETVALQLGAASFLPEGERRVEAERYLVTKRVWEAIGETKRAGGRVVAVGTTTVRTLESAWLADSAGAAVFDAARETSLFIRPGFRFQVVDLMVTNFHQPRSTHLALVAAFVGTEMVEKIYNHALRGPYRFLSYGDAMLLERG